MWFCTTVSVSASRLLAFWGQGLHAKGSCVTVEGLLNRKLQVGSLGYII